MVLVNVTFKPNSAIAEFETIDSPKNTAFSAVCLLTVHVSTLWSPNRFVSCLSGDLMVYPKIQSLILGRGDSLLFENPVYIIPL